MKINRGRIKDGKLLFVVTHGMTKTRQFNIWGLMLDRCNNPKSEAYKNYGDRGIRVCDRWKKFVNFWEDMKDGYSSCLTLGRIDNDGDYKPSNCRWETWRQQQNNRNNNYLITYQGKTQTQIQWSRELGIKQGTLANRLKNNWPLEKALNPEKHVNQYE